MKSKISIGDFNIQFWLQTTDQRKNVAKTETYKKMYSTYLSKQNI